MLGAQKRWPPEGGHFFVCTFPPPSKPPENVDKKRAPEGARRF
jgi:hypothetical protein